MNLSDLLCADCVKKYDRPFDNGDGKIRCEACAVEFYLLRANLPKIKVPYFKSRKKSLLTVTANPPKRDLS